MTVRTKIKFEAPGSLATAASSGITFAGSPVIIADENVKYLKSTKITVPTFTFTTTAAAKSVGQKVYSFPQGRILVVGASINTTLTTGAGTSSTAGEVGLGTVIGSGANATLGAVGATSEDIMEGQTIANGTASTANVITKAGVGVALFDHGATAGVGNDGSVTAKDVFFNIASTFGGTGGCTVSGTVITLHWVNLGTGA